MTLNTGEPSRRYWRYVLHTLLVLSPLLAIIIIVATTPAPGDRIPMSTGLYALCLWAWSGYLFWLLDRALARRVKHSTLQALLRTLLLVLFAWSPGALIMALVIAYRSQRRRLSLDSYIESYPDCYRNGRVYCHACGGSSIWMMTRSYSPFHITHFHVCRQCGIELYRSVLR